MWHLHISSKGPSDFSMEQTTLAITDYAHGVGSEHHQDDETQSSIRKALPEVTNPSLITEIWILFWESLIIRI